MQGTGDGDLDVIFANLGHSDRFIRYAARVALESQPIDLWRDRALSTTNPLATINAIMAVARQGSTDDREPASRH